MKSLSACQLKNMLIRVCDDIINSKSLLTEVDSAIGDGDHGIGMETGMKKAKAALEMTDSENVYEYFKLMGKSMLMSMGGASGVVFGSMFLSGGRNNDSISSINLKQLGEVFLNSLNEIKVRGGARVGDKTMVDALEPAVYALVNSKDDSILIGLSDAADAAKKGVESTKNFEAKFGRAKTQGSTIGYQDPGATSVWLIFNSMKDYVAELTNELG